MKISCSLIIYSLNLQFSNQFIIFHQQFKVLVELHQKPLFFLIDNYWVLIGFRVIMTIDQGKRVRPTQLN